MKTLKTEHGIKITVRSIEDFTDNAEIVELGRDHYSSGEYVEGFQVDMIIDATLADGTFESFTVSCQSADISTDKLRAHSRTEMRFAKNYGADWDESGELEEFVDYEDWDEIAEFLIGLAEDRCQEWYDDHKDERLNKSRGKKSKKESRTKASMQKRLESLRRGKKNEGSAREYTSRIETLVDYEYLTMEDVGEFLLRAFSEDDIRQAYGWMEQDELIPSEAALADEGLKFNDDGDLVPMDSDESYRRARRVPARESRSITQRELKRMAADGEAIDITTEGNSAYARELKNKGISVVGISRGVYGMNGALLRDNEGNQYVITARNTTLFYFV